MKLDVLKPWITKRTTELLKMEDDVVVEFIFNQLEEKVRPVVWCTSTAVLFLVLLQSLWQTCYTLSKST